MFLGRLDKENPMVKSKLQFEKLLKTSMSQFLLVGLPKRVTSGLRIGGSIYVFLINSKVWWSPLCILKKSQNWPRPISKSVRI